MKRLLFIPLLFILITIEAQDRITGEAFATRSAVIAKNGMVASSQPLATQIGIDILKQGGSAVDAAIAVNAALGLMEPTGSGIGGDLFAIVWNAKKKKLFGINASGRSPESLTLDYFKEKDFEKIPAHGPLPVSVPGCVDGWFELHDKFGKLSMDEILQPTIEYANEGFPLSELVSYYLQRSVPFLGKFPNVKETYAPNGRSLEIGTMFTNPDLGITLSKIAKEGRDAFYKGDIAKTMAKFIQNQGGFLSESDLAKHKSEWVEPMSTNYRGVDVWELPPNGQGIAALQMLNILESYDVAEMGFGSEDYVHIWTEAKKLAYEDRARYYADPDFNDIDYEYLVSKPYAKKRQKLIDPDRAARSYDAGLLETSNTIYLCTADSEGNMVSFIQSNYRGMGSGMVPPGLGFMLQDRGELFSLDEGHPNVYEPGKRPFHTIIPAFATKDGEPFLAFGVMGGGMQPQGHVQIIINMIDFGMGVQEAGDAPRMQHFGSSSPTSSKLMSDGGRLVLESGFDYSLVRKLMMKRHKVGYDLGGYGGYQAIMWDAKNKVYHGASESRKDGQAAGY